MKNIKVAMAGIGAIGKVHCTATLSIPMLYPKNDYAISFGKLLRNNTSGNCPFYFEGYAKDLDEILADDSVTCVDICSPNYLHFEQGMKVLEAGKSLYLEKPIGLNSDEAHILAKEAADRSIITQTALMYRMMPGVIAIRDMVESGELGDIIDFKLVTLHSGYLNPNRKRNWKLSKEKSGGGPLLDIGVHMADTVRFMLGDVDRVSCVCKTIIEERPDAETNEMVKVDIEDWANARLILRNGITGSIEVSRVASVLDQSSTIDVYGTKGSVHFSSSTPNSLLFHEQSSGKDIRGKAPAISDYAKYVASIYPSLNRGWLIDSHTVLLVNFYNNVNEGKIIWKESPSFEDDEMAQKIIEACYRSAEKDSNYEKVQ